jgi:hypothetical protein
MHGKTQGLKEKLERLLREAAETAADLQAAERGIAGPVHVSQIEAAAHAVGSQLSGGIQERVVREAVTEVRANRLANWQRNWASKSTVRRWFCRWTSFRRTAACWSSSRSSTRALPLSDRPTCKPPPVGTE